VVTHSEGGSSVVFKAEWTAYCSHCHLQSLNDFRGPKNGKRSVPDNGMVSAPAIGVTLFGGTPQVQPKREDSQSAVPNFFMILWDPAPYVTWAFKSRQIYLLASCCSSCLPISPNPLGMPESRSAQHTKAHVSFKTCVIPLITEGDASTHVFVLNVSELGRKEPAAVSLHVSQ